MTVPPQLLKALGDALSAHSAATMRFASNPNKSNSDKYSATNKRVVKLLTQVMECHFSL